MEYMVKNNAIAEILVVPIGTESTSLSHYVADCISILKNDRLVRYELTPMGTIIEGEIDRLLEIIKLLHEAPFKRGAQRVLTTIQIDDRRDKQASMRKKIASVKKIITETKRF